MTYQETGRYCRRCQRHVLARRQGTNHILHLLITCLLCGLWLPIWILASIRIGGWRCPRCGGKAT